MPGVEVEIWAGMFAPKGTSDTIVRRMNAALNRVVQDPSLADLLRKGAQEVRPMSVEQFGEYVDAQYRHWGAMARTLNVQPE